MSHTDPVRVVVAMDFNDDIMNRLRALSPRLHIERHFPEVPAKVWAETEVLYTLSQYPQPEQAPRLRWIQLHHAGVDRLQQHPIMAAQDVEISTASGVHAVQIAEYCLMMMMSYAYALPTFISNKAKLHWPQGVEDSLEKFAPHELRGSTLGIVGYGSIGRELARQADAHGMLVLATKRDVKHPAEVDSWSLPNTGDPEGKIPERFYPMEAVGSMAAECDYLVLTAPLTNATRHMINENILNRMKKSAVLVNIARGGLVDEAALISALAAERIRGAALDVFNEEPLPTTSPLWNLENVIISPHVAGNSIHYHEKAAHLFADNLERYLDNRPLLNRVDRTHGY